MFLHIRRAGKLYILFFILQHKTHKNVVKTGIAVTILDYTHDRINLQQGPGAKMSCWAPTDPHFLRQLLYFPGTPRNQLVL